MSNITLELSADNQAKLDKLIKMMPLRKSLLEKLWPNLEIISEKALLDGLLDRSLGNIGDRYVMAHVKLNAYLMRIYGICVTVVLHRDNFLTWPVDMPFSQFAKMVDELNVGDLECDICCSPIANRWGCLTCRKFTCDSCMLQVDKCPYCRADFTAVNDGAIEIIRSRLSKPVA